MGILVEFFLLPPDDGWEPEEPLQLKSFTHLSLSGPELIVPQTGQVLAVIERDNCWRCLTDPTLRWSDFRIMPIDGLLKVTFHTLTMEIAIPSCEVEWLQMTYAFLRYSPDGNDLAFLDLNGIWKYFLEVERPLLTSIDIEWIAK